MRFAMFFSAVLAAGWLVPGAVTARAGEAVSLEAIIAGAHRSPKSRARDKYRHPLATLRVFGLRPDMTVVEIWPGGGWYTDILAPYLKGRGHYYAAGRNQATTNARIQRSIRRYEAKLAARPDLFGEVVVTELSRKKTRIAPAGSADLVVTFRNVHNWMKFGFAETIFDAMFRALKPGGMLGVVEHRADPEDFPDPQALSGYVHEEQVKEFAADAGFEFVASYEVNANPRDNRHHPKGVWTLPPSLRLGETDRARYLAIGESDRMTLTFRRPK